jgi:hypothetical protein
LFGSFFKTELQMTNATEDRMTGWLYLRPHGATRRYDLEPHATISFADVVSELGTSGAGSLDILVDTGGVPTIVARAYDDQPEGTTGVTVPALHADSAITGTDIAALIAPRDVVRFRFNIGVRTLDSGAAIDLIVRDAAGNERHRRRLTWSEHHFEQQPGHVFAGIDLQSNDSIEVRVVSGSLIVYASTVDNQTNDSSLQVLRR